MTNYTTETYQIKRDILTFSKKINLGTRRPVEKFTQDIIYGMLSTKSCLLSDIARGLKENIKTNYTIERLSDNLIKLDNDEKSILEKNYYDEIMKYLPNDYVIILNDNTDLNKEYSKKLEDLCTVRDASSRVERLVNGYNVCEYVALTKEEKSPISLYSKIYSTISDGFKSENMETIAGEDYVKNKLSEYNKKAIFCRDRGYDANELLVKDIKENNKFVTRLKGNRMLIFNDKKVLVSEAAKERKGKISTKLMYHGENRDCYISYTKVKLPAYADKEISLVMIYGLDDSEDNVPMMLLTNLDVHDKNSAEHIARIYFLRWRIEEYFKAKKSLKWESSLLRSLASMNNLNFFLTVAMGYLSVKAEKLSANSPSNIILERAKSLKNKFLVYLSTLATGVFEILKHAHTGIKEWQGIEKRPKYKQLELNI